MFRLSTGDGAGAGALLDPLYCERVASIHSVNNITLITTAMFISEVIVSIRLGKKQKTLSIRAF